MSLEANTLLRAKIQKCEALARDPSTTPHEREAAQHKASELQLRLTQHQDYQSLVKEGRKYVERLRKDVYADPDLLVPLGGLTIEVTSETNTRDGQAKLRQYAADIGVDLKTLRVSRRYWSYWRHA